MLNVQRFTRITALQANGVISRIAKYLVSDRLVNIITLRKLFLGERYLAKHWVENFTLVCFLWSVFFFFLAFFFFYKDIFYTLHNILGNLGNNVPDGLIPICCYPMLKPGQEVTRGWKKAPVWGGEGSCYFISTSWVLLHICLLFLNCLKSFCKKRQDLNNRKGTNEEEVTCNTFKWSLSLLNK